MTKLALFMPDILLIIVKATTKQELQKVALYLYGTYM
jgi:hypothetical protein